MNKKPTPDTLLAAIHRHCLECSGGSRKEVHRCRMKGCALYPYREPEKGAENGRTQKGQKQLSVFDLTGSAENRKMEGKPA